MIPTHKAFMKALSLSDVTIVADAGMVSAANKKSIEGRRVVVHARRQDPRHPLRGQPMAHESPGR
jgi:hypothetical protein